MPQTTLLRLVPLLLSVMVIALPASARPIDPIDPPNTRPRIDAIAASPAAGTAPLAVSFTASAYDPDGDGIGYNWDFGDGGYSNEASPSHTYQTPGSFTALLTVTDDWGASASRAVTITVSGPGGNQPPHINSITASPRTGTAPLTVSFTADAFDPDGQIVAYSWDFGDGQVSGAASPQHTYPSPGAYTARLVVTDDGGAPSQSAAVTITVNGVPPSGADADADGLPDDFENQLADAFTPLYHVSAGERPGTGLATFADRSDVQQVQQVFGPVPPVSHFRVTPLFVQNGLGYLQIDYLTLWNRDDGLASQCDLWLDIILGIIGLPFDAIRDSVYGHAPDNERSALLVAAPLAANGAYSTEAGAYHAYRLYTAAHEDTFFSHDYLLEATQPLPAGTHVPLWLSLSKHGTYAFNPDFLPLFPGWIIAGTYGFIHAYYQWELFWAAYYGDWWRYLELLSDYYQYLDIADHVFFECVVERFAEQGGAFAGQRINVGELGRPINGSSFIGTQELDAKLRKRFRQNGAFE